MKAVELLGVITLVLMAAAIFMVMAMGLPLEMIGGKLAVLGALVVVAMIGGLGVTGARKR
jgi:hypothetical protein